MEEVNASACGRVQGVLERKSDGYGNGNGPIASFFFGDSQRMAVRSAVSWNCRKCGLP